MAEMKQIRFQDESVLQDLKKLGVRRGIACGISRKDLILEQAKRSAEDMRRLDKALKSLG